MEGGGCLAALFVMKYMFSLLHLREGEYGVLCMLILGVRCIQATSAYVIDSVACQVVR